MPLAAGCHGFLANNCLIRLELMPQCLRSSNKRRLSRRPQAASGPSLRQCCCCCMHTYAYVHERHGAEWTVPGERQARQRLAGMLGERLHVVREHTETCLRSSGVASVTTPRMRIHAHCGAAADTSRQNVTGRVMRGPAANRLGYRQMRLSCSSRAR